MRNRTDILTKKNGMYENEFYFVEAKLHYSSVYYI